MAMSPNLKFITISTLPRFDEYVVVVDEYVVLVHEYVILIDEYIILVDD